MYLALLVTLNGCGRESKEQHRVGSAVREPNLAYVKKVADEMREEGKHRSQILFLSAMRDSFPDALELRNMLVEARLSFSTFCARELYHSRETPTDSVLKWWMPNLVAAMEECNHILSRDSLFQGQFWEYAKFPVDARTLKAWIDEDIADVEKFYKDLGGIDELRRLDRVRTKILKRHEARLQLALDVIEEELLRLKTQAAMEASKQ